MDLHVYLPHPWEDHAMEHLRTILLDEIRLSTGPELPEPADYVVIVAGRPTREALEASPALAALIIPFAGLPSITKTLMAEFPRVAIHNIHHNALPTAEMAMALMLSAAKKLIPFDRNLRAHDWRPRYEEKASFLLRGKTLLVLGFGAVGRAVAEMARGFGMKIVAVRRREPSGAEGGAEVFPVSRLHEVLPRADVVALCLPATDGTEGLLGGEELALLPDGAILVNVGRGRTVEEEPLFLALEEGRLFGAGIDVWYEYPKSREGAANTPPSAFPFYTLESVIMSPHRAGHVAEDPLLRSEHLAELLNAAARGETLPNRVDPAAGY
ncbi:MAG: NAD(P)-dependent oxidoreductase [Planctomycetota bacterium]|jgi:phosphoglycerate dehydrogenase-like enzyme